MQVTALILPMMIVAMALAGCSEQCDRNEAFDGIDLKYMNLTDENLFLYYLYPWNAASDGQEIGFSPLQRDGYSAGSQLPYCNNINGNDEHPYYDWSDDTFYMHFWIREAIPDGDSFTPGDVVFDANFTGLRCAQDYIFVYQGAENVSFYEIVPCSDDGKLPLPGKKLRDLNRVPVR